MPHADAEQRQMDRADVDPSARFPEVRGRGAGVQPANPYVALQLEPDVGQAADDAEFMAECARPRTTYLEDLSETIVSCNESPDIFFRYSVNPYRGCVHGCSYCYARPTHEYLGFSAGWDFETKVLVKTRAPALFRRWLARPSWDGELIAFSGVTDCYQPVERRLQLTRGCLQAAAECRQPVAVITKNALVARDLDLLRELAAHNAVRVALSVTTLDQGLARALEPRTSAPAARLEALSALAAAGIPTEVMIAPVIPGLNDSEIPAILAAARAAGARSAGYLLLRLPTSVGEVFTDWLARRRPDAAAKIERLIRETRGGALSSARFGERQRGSGPRAEQIAQTFRVFSAKYGLADRLPPLESGAFRPPGSLF